jgi:hypothetical protein
LIYYAGCGSIVLLATARWLATLPIGAMILNNKALLCIGLPIQPERLAPVHDNAFLLELVMDMVLKYKDANIRTVEKDGRMLFVLADICGVLGLTNPSMVAKSLENDEKTIEYHKSDLGIKNESGNQNIIMINEAGLYNLIFKSEKPEAKDFKRWVTHDVLPSIRQYGFYIDDFAKARHHVGIVFYTPVILWTKDDFERCWRYLCQKRGW